MDAFDCLESEFGSWRVALDDYTIRYQRDRVAVTISYDAERSCEIHAAADDGNTEEPALELADVLRAAEGASSAIESVELMQIGDEEVASRLLRQATRLLCDHAATFLTGP